MVILIVGEVISIVLVGRDVDGDKAFVIVTPSITTAGLLMQFNREESLHTYTVQTLAGIPGKHLCGSSVLRFT